MSQQNAPLSWADRIRAVYPAERGEHIPALTDLWFRARRGRITASSRAAVLSKKLPARWVLMQNDINSELHESWTSNPFSNAATRWGQDHEAEAIANAEIDLGVELTEPGLLIHADHYEAAATPDFLGGDDIVGQIKCPYNSENHLKYLYTGTIPDQYYCQVNFEAWVSNRKKIVFMSYDPRQPPSARCAIVHAERNETLCSLFEENLIEFRKLMESGVSPSIGKMISVTSGLPNIF